MDSSYTLFSCLCSYFILSCLSHIIRYAKEGWFVRMEVDIHPYKVQLNIYVIVLLLQANSLKTTCLKKNTQNCMQQRLLKLRWWTNRWISCHLNSDGSATPESCESLFLYIKPFTIQNGDKGNKSLIIIICDTDSHTASRLCLWGEWADNGGGLPLSDQQERFASVLESGLDADLQWL